MQISVQSRIERTPRLQQVESLFDLKEEKVSRVQWNLTVRFGERPWNIGLITGPSGSGKSTIAKHLFNSTESVWIESLPQWPEKQPIVDGFPEALSIKEITQLLTSVGFSSPPAWLRPYSVLSTGQKFRADLSKLIASLDESKIAVMDEFTSVVDRTVAQIGSAALAKTVRSHNLKFVAVSCHEDVIDWLQPDWILRADTCEFAWRLLRQRPPIRIQIQRCLPSAWKSFAHHHYLSSDLAPGSTCFLALVSLNDELPRPAAFSAWTNQLTHRGGKREHRTVVLPDFQGIGIGMALSDTVASMWTGLGQKANSTTTHPGFVASRKRSPNWRMIRPPSFARIHKTKTKRFKHAITRLTTGFEYIGPAMPTEEALKLLNA